ncbi:tetrathionate reductase family octaheme c-type cytochrome [Desulfobotulus sp. H1]|uniref:Tetrathionate reductase family octaheme c-type cytochrome n=1 Tax=Desulfobotulus pelophilus TaxID=2823377 RepID=A0ABT3NAW1_9BACT|nr:tetrathionate reductase family octaheme c-type cytochrome [Desulfobotulus pelophilus]MCW7754594.1 tetrathionate reductase family octaheme c-type cytochrome [Desulfobotulus pelophilus]
MQKKQAGWYFAVFGAMIFGGWAAASTVSTADHSRFEQLKKEFASGPEVTMACLSCHNEAGSQFMKTIHWTWICPESGDGKLGKAGKSLNNYCISIPENEARCTSCHAGYGWRDDSFDFSKEENIDCLVCHEQTGTYKKYPTAAGYPVDQPTRFPASGELFEPPDWSAVAQSVARPGRANCGTCHFYGGGGDGVKHGDLDSSLFYPPKELDVHMSEDGGGFACIRCHTTVAHRISGRCYQTPAVEEHKSLIEDDLTSRITCVACHSSSPHAETAKLNDHTDKVACQTCHIPAYARGGVPTKMLWDWSEAGQLKEGRPYKVAGDLGRPVYDSQKGVFEWAENEVPEYGWFKGVIRNTLVTDIIDPDTVVGVNYVDTKPSDPNARIYPFKVHRGIQPYDAELNTLVFPKLFGPKGSGAYWSDFDWVVSIQKGMASRDLPFSGEVGFVETTFRYPITHMVAPKDQALSCGECHVREGSRLAGISGVYIPGRDSGGPLSKAGWMLTAFSILGVGLHAFLRISGWGGKK